MSVAHAEQIDAVAALGPVLPVLQVRSVEEAVSVCRALHEGGIRAFEITLRTPVALAAIEAVARLAGDIVVGAGTLVDPAQFADVARAGARFAASPGFTEDLAEAAERHAVPLLPGVLTPSDILRARAAGFTRLKFFPAQAGGGVAMLTALSGPFADVRFCATGGIDADNAPAYLALPNVLCVGGSWLAPRALLAARDWKAITRLAEDACGLASRPTD